MADCSRFVFFCTEGKNADGQRYESLVSDYDSPDDNFLRQLFEEFLAARKRGNARFMISNREREDWK